ncbi:M23 family metallopeptidase [bacterium]|nr:M23 family metallopeptidase [bacterium]
MKTIWAVFGILLGTSLLPAVYGQPSAGTGHYLWPTDASKYLTSAFCEYRGRRFHAGIDIKTWGRVGYKVFAIRPGYVWRISVSPFGYGKSIYVKLDTGEIALYAHLSRYSDRIQKVVDAEQQRLGRYRINKYFKSGQLPVQQGEVIAYTGQTGIGAPHLHFEVRDSANRPLNPLSKGYDLPDKTSPIITKVSVTPLDARSQVNGDFKPVVLYPKWMKPGRYSVDESVTVWGNVGFAVACYDKDSNSANSFGLYGFKLYIDDILKFQYQFDKMSFQENPMVELERDYRLHRRNYGRFHKLYKDKYNTRSRYVPNKTWAGVLQSASLEASPSLHSTTTTQTVHNEGALRAGGLFPGEHDFRIVVSDFFGNESTVEGEFQVGEFFSIRPIVNEAEDGSLNLHDVITYDLRKLHDVSTWVRNGKRWQPLRVDASLVLQDIVEKGGEGSVAKSGDSGSGEVLLLRRPKENSVILKFVATDQFSVPSYPSYYTYAAAGLVGPPDVTINYDYYNDYVRIELNSTHFLSAIPRVKLYPEQLHSLSVPLQQIGFMKYVGHVPLTTLRGENHVLEVVSENNNGSLFSQTDRFRATKISAGKNREMESDDRDFWVTFWPASLYAAIYGRIERDDVAAREKEMVSSIYDAEPMDVPLKAGAKVHFRYDDNENAPEKLGVYYKTRRGRWVFIDNELDTAEQTVSAKVFSLEKFVLMKDEVVPQITRLRPKNRSRLTTRSPRISANVKDTMSGIASENDIVIRLDGRRVIAEYDPERDRIFYQVKKPLAKGRHEISVWVRDRSQNESSRESVFWID